MLETKQTSRYKKRDQDFFQEQKEKISNNHWKKETQVKMPSISQAKIIP